MDPAVARKVWRTLEPYHGLVYFAPEAAGRYSELGMEGAGGYFASRSAAMGAVQAEVVIATFFNFRPSLVRAAIPSAWELAPPRAWVDARGAGIDGALRRCLGDEVITSTAMVRAAQLIEPAAASVLDAVAGRPLAGAHAATPRPQAPHLALWHSITVLREYRGDAHVACLTEAGIDGCEALVLHAATGEVPRAVLQTTRGWRDAEWEAAVDRLASRGLVDPAGAFTDTGRELRATIERRTDELAVPPWAVIGADGCEELRELVRPWSRAITDSGTFGFRP